jgi:hypothetical protein
VWQTRVWSESKPVEIVTIKINSARLIDRGLVDKQMSSAMDVLVNRRVSRVIVNDGNIRIYVNGTSEYLRMDAVGDCCSVSHFETFDGHDLQLLVDRKIVSIEESRDDNASDFGFVDDDDGNYVDEHVHDHDHAVRARVEI